MNKLVIAVLAALALGASATASAQSGTITFNGNVTATTCEVTFPGADSAGANPTITLATVSATSLATPGSTAGYKPFSMQVGSSATPCSAAGITGVAIELNPNHANGFTDGRLDNTELTGAKYVQVQLRDGSGTPIALSTTPWVSPTVPFVSGIATLGFSGEYYASGIAEAGAVKASLEYTLDYN